MRRPRVWRAVDWAVDRVGSLSVDGRQKGSDNTDQASQQCWNGILLRQEKESTENASEAAAHEIWSTSKPSRAIHRD